MDKIEVTQADRKAAASYHNQRGEHVTADFITKGERDDGYLVQAFARHRLATRTDATPAAWMYQSHVGTYPRIHRKQQTERYKVGWTEASLFSHPPATDVAALVEAAKAFQHYGCPVCSGDCGSANPPVMNCPMQALSAALAPFTKGQNDDA